MQLHFSLKHSLPCGRAAWRQEFFPVVLNLAGFVNNGNGAWVVTLSNFCITVIERTLETSQLCKASFLVLSCNLFGYKLPVAIFGITCKTKIR